MKASARVGWDGEAKRMVAYSKMRMVTILKVRRHRRRKEESTNHSVICVIVSEYGKTRLNVH